MSPEQLNGNLLPALIALKSDTEWRVRQTLLLYIPRLCQQLGREALYKELRCILLEWAWVVCITNSYMTDEVAAIRESAVDVLVKVLALYGEDFAEDTVLPTAEDLLHHEKYVLRVTGVHILTVREEWESEA